MKEQARRGTPEQVVKALRSRSWDDRARAVEALTDVRRAEIVPFLRVALADRELLVVIAALEVVADRRLRELVPEVLRQLRARDALVRGIAAETLGAIGGEDDRLLTLYRRDRSHAVRVRIAGTLFGRKSGFGLELEKYLNSPDYRVRCTALSEFTRRTRLSARVIDAISQLANDDPTRAVRTTAQKMLQGR
jgi:HEAT repeat protein